MKPDPTFPQGEGKGIRRKEGKGIRRGNSEKNVPRVLFFTFFLHIWQSFCTFAADLH